MVTLFLPRANLATRSHFVLSLDCVSYMNKRIPEICLQVVQVYLENRKSVRKTCVHFGVDNSDPKN